MDYKQREDVEQRELQAIRMKLGPGISEFTGACAEVLRTTTGWTRAMNFGEAVFTKEFQGTSSYTWQVLAQVKQITYPYVPLRVEIEAKEYLAKEARCLLVAHITLDTPFVPAQLAHKIRDYILASANLPGDITIRNVSYPIKYGANYPSHTEQWSAKKT